MNFNVNPPAALLAALGLGCGLAIGAPAWHADWLPPEVAAVVAIASTNHPGVLSARHERAAAQEDRRALDSFYSPSASLAGGASRGPSEAPATGLSAAFPDDALGAYAGLRAPVAGGAYLGVGAAQRRLDSALPDGASVWQTLGGVRLSVPLLQDAGFASQHAREEAADETALQRGSDADAAMSVAGHDVAAAYAYELYAAALVAQYRKALGRVEALLGETAERVKLETMAEYQVYPAEMEVQFKRDDVRQYETVRTNAHHALELAAGGATLPQPPEGLLGRWAAACATADVARIVATLGGERPEVAAARRAVLAAEARGRELAESARSSLSLSAGVGYQGEGDGFGVGSEAMLRDDRAGFDVALVWSRPLSFDGEEAAVRAQRRRTAALRERLRRIEAEALAQRLQAEARLQSAVARMATVSAAVEAASKALAAESERLSLGEGRSKNVLDAQTDLTSAEGRANLAAYDLVCSFLDLMLAAGVPLDSAAGAGEGD